MAHARQQTYSLDHKVVFLTGAGGGLGAATAALLTQRGAQVALVDIDRSAAERTARTLPPGQVLTVDCDVTAIDSIHAAVRKAEDRFGPIDVAIANAGLMGRGGTFRTLTTDEVDRVLSVNVSGVLNTVVGDD